MFGYDVATVWWWGFESGDNLPESEHRQESCVGSGVKIFFDETARVRTAIRRRDGVVLTVGVEMAPRAVKSLAIVTEALSECVAVITHRTMSSALQIFMLGSG